MKRKNVTFLISSVLFLGILLSSGCILDPKEEFNPPPRQKIDWKPLTDKEDCIDNILLAYKNYSSPEAGIKYEELLHEDYIWFMQEDGGSLVKNEDVNATKGIFEHALILELDVIHSAWDPVPELGGEPCEDCWETIREYYITAKFDPVGLTYNGHDLVSFVVVPVMAGSTKKYKVYQAMDIKQF